MKILLLILILKWPWNPWWIPEVVSAEVFWAFDCGDASACYHSSIRTIIISPDQDEWRACGGLERIIIHELQHHLQFETRMFERDEWDEFRNDVADFVLYSPYDLSEHQQRSLRALMGRSDELWELHAELPIIMEGDIPVSLARWYPWFRGLQ